MPRSWGASIRHPSARRRGGSGRRSGTWSVPCWPASWVKGGRRAKTTCCCRCTGGVSPKSAISASPTARSATTAARSSGCSVRSWRPPGASSASGAFGCCAGWRNFPLTRAPRARCAPTPAPASARRVGAICRSPRSTGCRSWTLAKRGSRRAPESPSATRTFPTGSTWRAARRLRGRSARSRGFATVWWWACRRTGRRRPRTPFAGRWRRPSSCPCGQAPAGGFGVSWSPA
jgi:hypothetical protein